MLRYTVALDATVTGIDHEEIWRTPSEENMRKVAGKEQEGDKDSAHVKHRVQIESRNTEQNPMALARPERRTCACMRTGPSQRSCRF